MDSVAELRDRYASMPDDQILQIAGEGGLGLEAVEALVKEMSARGLKESDVIRHGKEVAHQRLQMQAGNNVFFRVRGTGIAFRGQRFASQEDQRLGIPLCTRWFILCWIPLFPLGSYRIRYHGPAPRFWRRRSTYEVISQEELDWKMVLRVWSVTALVFLLLYLALWLLIRMHAI